ncbi:MAG: hypothetical protein C0474_09170 [Sphingobium sp.]|nr:hypothetical protein [Sphingobium sp.]
MGQSNWVNFEWQVSRDELGRLSGERVDQAQIRFNGQKLITLRDVSMKSTGVLLGEGCKLSNDPAGYEIKPVD